MSNEPRVLTTGDVAEHCGVSRMGVIRWIQAGKLKAYATPGGHYRIRTDDFRTFLRRYGMPVDGPLFDGDDERVLVIADDPAVLGVVIKALTAMSEGLEIDVALNGRAAAEKIAAARPTLIVLDALTPGTQAPEFSHWLYNGREESRLCILLLASTTPQSTHEHSDRLTHVAQQSLPRVSLDIERLQSAVRDLLGTIQ